MLASTGQIPNLFFYLQEFPHRAKAGLCCRTSRYLTELAQALCSIPVMELEGALLISV